MTTLQTSLILDLNADLMREVADYLSPDDSMALVCTCRTLFAANTEILNLEQQLNLRVKPLERQYDNAFKTRTFLFVERGAKLGMGISAITMLTGLISRDLTMANRGVIGLVFSVIPPLAMIVKKANQQYKLLTERRRIEIAFKEREEARLANEEAFSFVSIRHQFPSSSTTVSIEVIDDEKAHLLSEDEKKRN